MRVPFSSSVGVGVLLVLSVGGSSTVTAQGQVLGGTKISDTLGNFTAVLDDQDQFGRSVARLGDVDGDGISDLAVGAQGDDDGPGGLDRGAVYVLFLTANGVVRSHQKIAEGVGGLTGFLEPGDQFGRAIGAPGDVDGDGVPDLAVGSNFDDDGGTNRGAVYILFLNPDGTVRSTQKISSLSGNFFEALSNFDEFGRSLAGMGDLDADGVPDLVVGASYDDDGGTNKGAVYILLLNPDGTVKASQKISQLAGNLNVTLRGGDFFGHAVANLGDLDKDGVNDLVVGSVLDDDGGENRGAIYLILLNADGTVKDRFKISDTQGGFTGGLRDIDQFGVSVAGLGDLDGDGIPDVAVGAVKDDDGGTMTSSDLGAVWILLLNADGTVKKHQKISATQGDLRFTLDTGDWFGSSVSVLGGWPGDGPFDLAVGARYDDDGGGNHGAVYLLELNPTSLLPPVADFSALPQSGFAPLTVAFSDLSSGDVSSWQWSFGDGEKSTLQNPIHTYGQAGTYTVSMIAKNAVTADTVGYPGLIVVAEPPPAAGFTSSVSGGDAPLAVAFTDTSTLNITSWNWDFGDGTTSTLQNPSHVYSAVGTFTVSLTVTSQGGSDTFQIPGGILVTEPLPVASFEPSVTAGEAPLIVAFQDASTLNITSWTWDFGDGTVSTLSSPTHVYDRAGTFTVSLTVTSSAGSDTRVHSTPIVVTEPVPVAAFSASQTTGNAPLTVAFTDLSTLNITSWSWDFGDGTLSTLSNPTHTYTDPGTYSVGLTVTSAGGMDQRLESMLISVSEPPPVASFTTDVSSGFPPLGIAFSDTSTLHVTGWTWDFGDGNVSTLQNPTHTYAVVGRYSVGLTVTSAGGADSVTLIDRIEVLEPPPVASFTASTSAGEAPLTVAFTDGSTLNVTGWSWDFGDGSTSTAANPTHTYSQAGLFTVSLTVTSAGGVDTRVDVGAVAVTEPAPVAAFSLDVTSGTAPLTVSFQDASTLNITSWSWDFGDGTTSTVQHPVHVFDTGDWTVSLTVSSPGGTDTRVVPMAVSALEPVPVAAFSTANGVGDPPLLVSFQDASTLNITSWSWDFGDGTTSTLRDPTHLYETVGRYDVALTVTSAGGVDTLLEVGVVEVTEPLPVASFSASTLAGEAPLSVQFTDSSTLNVTSWSWDFGDGTTSTLRNPSHVYRAAGLYTVSLTVTSAGGTATGIQADLIAVAEPVPVANFVLDVAGGEAPLTVNFTDTSTLNVTSWVWAFGDGATSTLRSPSHTYSTSGTFDVSLTVTSAGGTDTRVLPGAISVTEPAPVASFSVLPMQGDVPLEVAFTDLSTLNVTSWLWDFGDGTTSTLQDPLHTYTTVGSYSVSLTVTSAGGMATSMRPNLIVAEEPPPVAGFTLDVGRGPAPLAVAFTDTTTGMVTAWLWDFGDGMTSTLQHPVHTFEQVGTYAVTLTSTGPGGSDTRSQASAVVVDEPPPMAVFSGFPESGTAPLTVSFTDASTLNVTSWSWDFGDGGTSTLQNPTHTYEQVGTYGVTLTVQSPGGIDTASQVGLIQVAEPPPQATFSLTPAVGDKPLTVTFTDQSTLNVTSWLWDFGDGATSTLQNPSHVYTEVGTYTVSLSVTSAGGTDTRSSVGAVSVEEPPPSASFGLDVSVGDPPLGVTFTDTSSGAISGWTWSFGDGATSTLQSPTHTYQTVGTYDVSLTVTGPGGSDVSSVAAAVRVTEPVPVAAFTRDVAAGLAPLSVAFTDASTLNITSWLWDFGDGSTSTLQNPVHVYEAVGSFGVTLTVTSAGGTDTLAVPAAVVTSEPPPVAGFSVPNPTGPAPWTVSFADESTLHVTSWMWDFGDGGTSTLQNPTHTYESVGTYTVGLTVTSSGGTGTLVVTDAIVVVEPPPAPAFAAAPSTGTAPLTVSFSDATAGMVSGWTWDFGDGATSTLQNPTHTYEQVGTFSVGLTATGPGGSGLLVQEGLIQVLEPPPTASFTVDTTAGQAPLSVSFTDTSRLNVTSWNWDLGDGTTATTQHPTHVYEWPGTYSVSLAVSSAGGTDAVVQPSLVTVSEPPPVASFGADVQVGTAPLTVAFNDLSTLHVTTWNWDFGDGTSSNLQHPTHVYAQVGTFDVALTVTSAGGSDTTTVLGYVSVAEPPPTAAFTFGPGSGPAPLTVAFTDASLLNVTTWSWDFGDGTTSTLQDPTHTYQDVGSFTVVLTVTSAGGTATTQGNVPVVVTEPPPAAAFSANATSGPAPLGVSFTDASTLNVTAWSWDFGDGTTSTLQNPTHVYEQVGTFDVSLSVTSAGGMDSRFEPAYVTVVEPAPTASFDAFPSSGPAPLGVAFTDTSTLNVTSWTWDFGDGATSTLQNPTHQYDTVGTFTVSLSVASAGGMDTRVVPGLVTVQEPPPTAAFAADQTSGSAPLAVAFSDQSTLNVTGWAWDFGDGGTATVQNPVHEYTTPGTFDVSLTVSSAGGVDTALAVGFVTVLEPPPTAAFTVDPPSGAAPLQVAFTDASLLNVTAWSWDFGDGGMSTLADPTHTFALPGTYTVTLTVTSAGGTDTLVLPGAVTVVDPPPTASFSALPTQGSAPLTVVFNDLSSGPVTGWSWDFGDGFASTEANPTHVYENGGLFSVTLSVVGPGGSDALMVPDLVSVQIDPPFANFDGVPTRGFAPLTVSFSDLSTGLVTNWSWDFGDGGTSTSQNPTHVYVDPGSYTVALIAGNGGGVDTERKLAYVQVAQPPVFRDGSFEDQLAGTQPRSPWRVLGGTMIGVNPTTHASDNGMPTDGSQWLEVGADGTVAAQPPSNPGGAGTPPLGTAQVRQDFTYQPDAPYLAFQAAFLLDGPQSSVTLNDFMSVDVTDGVSTYNLFYADSFSGFPLLSEKYGLPMTDLQTVVVDMSSLFPAATATTILTLSIHVGNGGDGNAPSKGYVDSIVVGAPAGAVYRNGTGLNSSCYQAPPPVLGGPWTAQIDSSAHTGATLVVVLGYAGSSTGPEVASGELLVDLASPLLLSLAVPSNGLMDSITETVPSDLSLLGLGVATQGLILGGGSVEFCNAYDLTVGF